MFSTILCAAGGKNTIELIHVNCPSTNERIVRVVGPVIPTPSIVTYLVFKNESVARPLPSIVTFLIAAGLIVTLLFGQTPEIGPFNLKPNESVGAV